MPVDGFVLDGDDSNGAVLTNDRFELTLYRQPVPGPRPTVGLIATWDGHADSVVLAEVTER